MSTIETRYVVKLVTRENVGDYSIDTIGKYFTVDLTKSGSISPDIGWTVDLCNTEEEANRKCGDRNWNHAIATIIKEGLCDSP